MRRLFFALMLGLVLASAPAGAHKGHAHKIMGTIAVVHESHFEVTATDGKTATLTLTEKTKIIRGKVALKITDLQPGNRVVVTATETKAKDGKTSMVATHIQLGTAATPSAKQ